MADSANRLNQFQKRANERESKAESYTVNKSIPEKMRAKLHVHTANTVDFSLTAMGSKTLSTMTNGLWGAGKGLLYGAGFAIVLGTLLSTGMGVGLLAASVAYFGFQGCRDGYYHAEANYSGNKAKRVGDKIAAEGNAQAPKVKPKVMAKAIEQAKEEGPTLNAAERQSLDHANPNAVIGQHTQRVVDARNGISPTKTPQL